MKYLKSRNFRFWGKTRNDGKNLERRVVNILQNLGQKNIKTNTIITDSHGNRSEIDVCCGYFDKLYVECKEYYGHNVPLEDVSKFKSVLELNKIPLTSGLFVTTADFTPRSRCLGIKTLNGEEFAKWELEASHTRKNKTLIVLFLCIFVGTPVAFLFLSDRLVIQLFGEDVNKQRKQMREFVVELTQYPKT